MAVTTVGKIRFALDHNFIFVLKIFEMRVDGPGKNNKLVIVL